MKYLWSTWKAWWEIVIIHHDLVSETNSGCGCYRHRVWNVLVMKSSFVSDTPGKQQWLWWQGRHRNLKSPCDNSGNLCLRLPESLMRVTHLQVTEKETEKVDNHTWAQITGKVGFEPGSAYHIYYPWPQMTCVNTGHLAQSEHLCSLSLFWRKRRKRWRSHLLVAQASAENSSLAVKNGRWHMPCTVPREQNIEFVI